MDAIFSSLLADVCDLQVCAAFGFYLPPMPDMFDRIMTGSSSPLRRSCPGGRCVGVWQESWPMAAAVSGDEDEERECSASLIHAYSGWVASLLSLVSGSHEGQQPPGASPLVIDVEA